MNIQPANGKITGYDGPSGRTAKIEIPVMLDGPVDEKGSDVRLEFIEFPNAALLSDLSNREFTFPINPDEGYIDGSIYVGHAHNPCDVVRIKFGQLESNMIPAEIWGKIDFDYEGVIDDLILEFHWQVLLIGDPNQPII